VKRSVLVIDGKPSITIGGLTLTERAVLLAHRAGIPVRIAGVEPVDETSVERLHSRGVPVIQQPAGSAPLDGTTDEEGVVLIGPNVLFGPVLLAELLDRTVRDPHAGPIAVYERGVPLVLYLPPGTGPTLRACRSLEAMVAELETRGGVRELPGANLFCRRVHPTGELLSVERAFVRHLNGTGESYFTKKIRRFSVPLSTRLVRLGARPTHVTLGGLLLAVVSAWFLSRGTYGAGLLGAALYYVSMVFDCSDGEVARLTIRDSPSGAWLETVVDYATYFVVLAGLAVGSQRLPGAGTYLVAAAVAVVGSGIVIAVAGYLRFRVAAADPGQFDDASAKAMASATRLHRFGSWARQWIKRSTLAHVLVALAIVDRLSIILYLWAFAATVSALIILAVEPFVARRVTVRRPGAPVDASG
jgi:phosphatidylglycerophosphate synthase